MKTVPIKLNVVRLVIEHDVKPFVREGYIKVTEKSLTTRGTTGQAVWITYQLVSLVLQRTDAVSLLTNLIDINQ